MRERDRVRGMKIESINILGHYHPHPDPPPSRGRGKSEFPDGNYLVFPFVVSLSNHKKILLQEPLLLTSFLWEYHLTLPSPPWTGERDK